MQVVFDNGRLSALLQNFYILAGLRIGVYDANGNEMAVYPQDPCLFCQTIRSNPSLDEKCKDCDLSAYDKARSEGDFFLYRCHAGITEVIFPILTDGTLIGYIMIGQFLELDENKQIKNRIPAALDIYFAKDELSSLFRELPVLSKDKLDACMEIAKACAGYIILDEMVRPGRDEDFGKILSFIDANLSSPLSVGTLCKGTGLSRRMLYNCLRRNGELTPVDLIHSRRIKTAKKLLASTELPVSEIAFRCGIYDVSYFSRLFKKLVLCTPSQYREAAQKK